MKIISKQTDYYDYLTNVYGVDDKIVYEREISKNVYDIVWYPEKERIYYNPKYRSRFLPSFSVKTVETAGHFRYRYSNAYIKFLVVCGKVYPIFFIGKDGKPVTMYSSINVDEQKPVVYNSDIHRGLFERVDDISNVIGSVSEPVLEIQKEVGLPVFLLDCVGTDKKGQHFIDARPAPLLSKLNFESLYPADQIYQDICYFISNILNESPDVQPAGKPPMTDKEKIVARGFDLKTSFRGKQK